ncbi:MAG: hypothetical protein WA624_05745 [Methylocella sp.]
MANGKTRRAKICGAPDRFLRRCPQQWEFEDQPPFRYHAVTGNRPDEKAAATIKRYARRGEAGGVAASKPDGAGRQGRHREAGRGLASRWEMG